MRNGFLLLFVLFLMVSCKDNVLTDKIDLDKLITEKDSKSKGLNEMNWLLGIWDNKSDDMLSKEMWSKKNDETFTGFSYRLYKKDTVFAEKMILEKKHDDIRLTVISVGQTPEERVSYNLITSKNKEFIFENKSREFPKRIAYKKEGDNALQSWIEGSVLGENEKIVYRFTRKK